MTVGRTRYRFGLFEADPHSGRLLRQGETVRLQDQPFHVLIALLERHGDVVTRDDLRARLWPGDTFVEFDKSLGVALSKVRAALGDDASNPRFVETVPRRGYRFIAPVSIEAGGEAPAASTPPIAELPVASPASLPADAWLTASHAPSLPSAVVPAPSRPSSPPALPSASRSSKVGIRPARVWLAAVAVVLVLASIAGVSSYWRRGRSTSAAARVSTIVAEFTNTTGDPVFVGSLRRAAVVALRQSPFVSVMADAAIADSLQALGRAPNDTLTAPLARDVCMRAHASVLVAGDISLASDTYTLVVDASRCADGRPIAHESATFTNKDAALPALGGALDRIRQALGESRESLENYDVPIQVATTDSIEALRAFHLGMDLRTKGDNLRAIPALKTAVALDPQFALAYAQLGSSYSNMGNTIEATPYLSKAFELRGRATEPERLYITGRYFDIVTGELEKGSETYRLWTHLYPDEWLPFNALANDANQTGRYDVAVDAATRANQLNPKQLFGRINLMTALIAENRLADGVAAARAVLALAADDVPAHLAIYAIALHQHDAAAVARERAWGARHSNDAGMPYVDAEEAGGHGRMGAMRQLFHDAARLERAAGNDEAAGNALAFSAVLSSVAGFPAAATADAHDALALGGNEIIAGSAGIVDARSGRAAAAEQRLAGLNHDFPLNTANLGMFAPMIRGALLGAPSGKRDGPPTAADVTNAMSAGLPYEYGQLGSLQAPYLRGVAYLAAQAPDSRSRGVPQGDRSRRRRPGDALLLALVPWAGARQSGARPARRKPPGLCDVSRAVEGRRS